MKIKLNSLTITNFKGIKSLEVKFNHNTNIFGENAAGKTSVFDAFTWLFFGKDSTDRKDFELKPLDKAGNPMQKVDVEVSALVDVDGKSIEIKRILREKWVKKRGDLNPEFSGNENLFYWNDVPLQLKQFQEKIGDLMDENTFKLITHPLYFNHLKWQDRRSVLLAIAGNITNDELVAVNPDFKQLIKSLGDKSLEEYKREISVKKKKLKDDLQAIPTRIDEITKNMPEEVDFDSLRSELQEKLSEINIIDESLQTAIKALQSKHEGLRTKQNRLHELKTSVLNIRNDVRSVFSNASLERKRKLNELQSEINESDALISSLDREIKSKKESKDEFDMELDVLRNEWARSDSLVLEFNENEFKCPACQRPLDDSKIEATKEKLTNNFNTDKAKKLTDITGKATRKKELISKLQDEIEVAENKQQVVLKKRDEVQVALDSAKTEHEHITSNAEAEFNKQLENHKELQTINGQISTLETELQKPVEEEDNSELKQQKAALNISIDKIKRQLTDEDLISKANNRKEELHAQEKQLAQQLADLEGSEYLAEQFTKAKMDTLVKRINGRFKYVTFKLFDTQINGGEVETCETLVNGVPFTDANNAAKINAGLDIINTLCEHYGVYAPIFIDNRESVNNLIDCDSQVVNLIVSTDKKLRVA